MSNWYESNGKTVIITLDRHKYIRTVESYDEIKQKIEWK